MRGRLRGKLQALQALAPTYAANFLFQRVMGVNRDCGWPVHFTSKVQSPECIHIHPSVRRSFAVSGGCYIQAQNGLYIGEGTIFAFGVKIITADYNLPSLKDMRIVPPVRIGKHCWLGANAVVLPGVELGDHVVVGAGAVVTKSFPSHSVVVGIPAQLLRTIATPEGPGEAQSPG